jgi:hypothetical protein
MTSVRLNRGGADFKELSAIFNSESFNSRPMLSRCRRPDSSGLTVARCCRLRSPGVPSFLSPCVLPPHTLWDKA